MGQTSTEFSENPVRNLHCDLRHFGFHPRNFSALKDQQTVIHFPRTNYSVKNEQNKTKQKHSNSALNRQHSRSLKPALICGPVPQNEFLESRPPFINVLSKAHPIFPPVSANVCHVSCLGGHLPLKRQGDAKNLVLRTGAGLGRRPSARHFGGRALVPT